jgi:FlaA1/EpsC-like NDP-sugar epimerase
MNTQALHSKTKRYRRHYQRVISSVALDVCVIVVAFIAVFSARTVNADLIAAESIGPIALNAITMVMFLYLFGVYQRMWTRTSGNEARIIVYAVVVDTAIFSVYNLLSQPRPLPISVVVVGNVLALCGLVAVRYRSRLISGLGWRWRLVWRGEVPRKRTRVLVVGAGESGQAFVWRLKYRSVQHEYTVVGFVDDDPEKLDMYVEGSRVLGNRHDIARLVEMQRVDLIVVAVHRISGSDFRDILALCEQTKALIKVVPDVIAAVETRTNAVLLRDVQLEDLIGRSGVSRYEAVDLTPVTNRVILVTGAAGSIGSELSRQVMLYEPKQVILLDNNESGLHDLVTELASRFPHIELHAVLGDVATEATVREAYTRHMPQIVFHAAAYKHVPMLEFYPAEALRVNIIGTRNLAVLAHEFRVERFVLISTDKAVNPSSVMGATKRVCELILHLISQQTGCQTLFTAVRFGNVLGSRGSVVPTFERQIDNGGPITVTHPDMTRYFMSIPEAVNLIIHAACMTAGNDVFILRMGEEVRIVELAERMIRMRGLRPNVDIHIKFTGMRPGEKLHEELYHGDETPEETIHPNIICLRKWDDFDQGLFWQRLDKLLGDQSANQAHVLERLRQIIHHDSTFAVSAD